MVRSRVLAAIGGVAALCCSAMERVEAQAASREGPAASEAVAPSTVYPATVYPGVREFHWTLHVPILTWENKALAVDAPTTGWHPQRLDYDGADMRTERRSLGKIPEFSCKYPDLMLPNECRTVWHDVYADLPVLVSRPHHVEVDVPEWKWQRQLFPMVVPRWTWTDKSFTLSVPTIVTEKP